MNSIQACVFDAYGTLFDVHSAVRRHSARIGSRADEMSALWRQRQTEYSWTRSLMGRHADFWQLTRDALRHAMQVCRVEQEGLEEALMSAYLQLQAFDDVRPALEQLRRRGLRTGILSNGTPDMVAAAVRSCELDALLDFSLSIEAAGVFKPHPSVYRLVCEHAGLAPAQVAFMSSNAWDAAGASSFGFRVVWVNRDGRPREYGFAETAGSVTSLRQLPDLLKTD